MYPDVQDLGNAVGPIEDGLFVDGLFVDGLFVEGLFVDGLFVDGLAVVGLFVDGFVVDGLVDDGFVVDGLLLVGLLVGLVCSARVVITFSSVFTSSTRTEARLFLDLFLNKPTSASCSRLGVTSVVSFSERRIVDAYQERNMNMGDNRQLMHRCQFLTASTILLLDPLPKESTSRIANDSCETCMSTKDATAAGSD